jgi:hypothetical protein
LEFEILKSTDCDSLLRKANAKFYVYLLFRPNGVPFYVGKGIGRRVFNHEAEARNTSNKTHKLNVIRAIIKSGGTIGYSIPRVFDDEAEAHAYEVELINTFGRHDLKRGPLTNQTDGGEGVIGLSDETRLKKAANLGGASSDPDRRRANEFFHSIAGGQESVPIKPLGVRKLQHTTAHPSARVASARMSKVLVAGSISTNQLLAAGVIIPRLFDIEESPYVIENGVSRDMLKAGMIELIPGDKPELEKFRVTNLGYEAIIKLIGQARLEDLGVLEPTNG